MQVSRVKWSNHNLRRLGRSYASHLIQGHFSSVYFHANTAKHIRVGPSGSDFLSLLGEVSHNGVELLVVNTCIHVVIL